MLNILGKSEIRKKLILLFIYNTDKEYYVNQLSRLLNVSLGTTQRELKRLLKDDFIISIKKGNIVFYTLNKENILLSEIESIIKKTIGIENILKIKLGNMDNIKFAFIFGSYAKNSFRSTSDIDLYIIGKVDEDKLYDIIQESEMIIQREINYHIATLKEFSSKAKRHFFEKEILKDIIFIKGRQKDFEKIIK